MSMAKIKHVNLFLPPIKEKSLDGRLYIRQIQQSKKSKRTSLWVVGDYRNPLEPSTFLIQGALRECQYYIDEYNKSKK